MRASIRWLLACVLAVLVIYKLGWDRSDLSGLSSPLLFGLDETPRFQSITASNHSELQTEEGLSFWVTLAPILEETRPLIPKLPPTGPSTGIEALINHFANLPVGYERHQDLLRIPDRDVGQMQDAHTAYVQRTADLAAKLPFKKGTKGIVTTAVGPFLPILVVTLRMLRRTGSKLPVEVFVESWESYEKAACEEILPTLNARCLVLSDVLATTPNDIEPSKYQVKAFALLMSSFEDILLLDADSIPMEKPDGMLSSEPFSSTGLVTWPDYVSRFQSILEIFSAVFTDRLFASLVGLYNLSSLLQDVFPAPAAFDVTSHLRIGTVAHLKIETRGRHSPFSLLQPVWPQPLLRPFVARCGGPG